MTIPLFNNKYRIPSARLQGWNYANAAMYFVTICTRNREHYFGEIVDSVLQSTEIGKFAHDEWYNTAALRPDMHLELGEFVVMPNHVHGIIIIGDNGYNSSQERGYNVGGDGDDNRTRRDAMHCVSTPNANTPIPNDAACTDARHCVSAGYKNQFAPQSKNLSAIIRGYKSVVTTCARKNNLDFGWQPRFYDHIIRSADSYHRISGYITNNPARWKEDTFYQS